VYDYDNFTFIIGDQSTDFGDGSAVRAGPGDRSDATHGADAATSVPGTMSVSNPAIQFGFLGVFSWTVNPGGTATYYRTFVDGNTVNANVNPDGSGFVTYTENGRMRFTASWNTFGNGIWHAFDELGVETGTGTW